MRLIVTGFVALLTLSGCDSVPGKPRPAEREPLPSEVMTFDALFSRNCAGCHGANGRLGAARALNDPVYLALVPRERVRQVIAAGVPGTAQPAFALSAGGPLTDAQIEILIDGLNARWRAGSGVLPAELPLYDAGPMTQSDRGATDRGRVVYAAGCAACHGEDGRGGPRGGAIVDPSYLALVSDQHLRTTVLAGRSDLGMPDWRGGQAARPLTPQQISDVVAWIVAQRKPVPGRLP
jgi:mono/diheme cytochrome c family protein